MSDGCFTARALMKAQVLDLFKDLELKKNGSEQYDHASAQILLKGVESRLKQI